MKAILKYLWYRIRYYYYYGKYPDMPPLDYETYTEKIRRWDEIGTTFLGSKEADKKLKKELSKKQKSKRNIQ